MPATNPDPERISLSVPLIPRRRSVLAARGDPLAHIESRRITPCKKAWNKFKRSKINNCNKKKKKQSVPYMSMYPRMLVLLSC